MSALVVAGALSQVAANSVSGLERSQLLALNRAEVNGFDRWATRQWSESWQTRSDHLHLIAWSSSAGTIAIAGLEGGLFTTLVMGLEVGLAVGSVTQYTKVATRRIRPYAYNSDVSVDERYAKSTAEGDVRLSFFSGHVSTAFTAAVFASTVLDHTYPDAWWTKWVWASTLAAASGTAYARIKAGKHYPTDVLTAAAVGSAIAFFLPKLHERDGTAPPGTGDGRVGVAVSPGGLGFRIGVGPGR
jgi:membrane-associated phospholipid phosphatase